MSYSYEYPRPALTVDCVIFAKVQEDWQVLLIERANEPFAGSWALPGGFVDPGEDLPEAARRELAEETGLRGIAIEQLQAFGKPGRDPRGWVVSVAFSGRTNPKEQPIRPASDARQARWFAVRQLPKLAFDHGAIIATAMRKEGIH